MASTPAGGGDVPLDRDGTAALLLHRVHGRRSGTEIDGDDVGAALGQFDADRGPETAGGPGHDRGAALM